MFEIAAGLWKGSEPAIRRGYEDRPSISCDLAGNPMDVHQLNCRDAQIHLCLGPRRISRFGHQTREARNFAAGMTRTMPSSTSSLPSRWIW